MRLGAICVLMLSLLLGPMLVGCGEKGPGPGDKAPVPAKVTPTAPPSGGPLPGK